MRQIKAQQNTRINVQVPLELKEKLDWASTVEGKKRSILIRESIEQKLEQIETRIFNERIKNAYLELAKENIEISNDFEYSDAENL